MKGEREVGRHASNLPAELEAELLLIVLDPQAMWKWGN